MKSIRSYTLTAMLVLGGPAVLAADEVDHAAHHAGVAVPSATPPTATTSEGTDNGTMIKMDAQMQAMEKMHNKMMNAKSPEERKAMMAEHMKAMQDGMKMMEGMSVKRDMGGMSKMKEALPASAATHHEMMERRMGMMEMMMRMMMDRLPAQ
jgi:hypothetical protein